MLTTWYLQESKLGKRERERIVCRCAISDKYEDVPLPFLSKWDEWSSGPVRIDIALFQHFWAWSAGEAGWDFGWSDHRIHLFLPVSLRWPRGLLRLPQGRGFKMVSWFKSNIYHISCIHYHPFSGICVLCFHLLSSKSNNRQNVSFELLVFLPRFFVSSVQGPRWTRWTRWSPLSGWLWKSRIGQGEGTGRSGGWQKSLIPKSQNH